MRIFGVMGLLLVLEAQGSLFSDRGDGENRWNLEAAEEMIADLRQTLLALGHSMSQTGAHAALVHKQQASCSMC